MRQAADAGYVRDEIRACFRKIFTIRITLDHEAFYHCRGKDKVSLSKRDGKMYLVLTPQKFVGDGDHIHWWKDEESKEYEIILSNGTIKLNPADVDWYLDEMWPDVYRDEVLSGI